MFVRKSTNLVVGAHMQISNSLMKTTSMSSHFFFLSCEAFVSHGAPRTVSSSTVNIGKDSPFILMFIICTGFSLGCFASLFFFYFRNEPKGTNYSIRMDPLITQEV